MNNRPLAWWGCVALVTCGWVFLLPLYHSPSLVPAAVCLSGAVLLAFVAVGRRDSPVRGSWFLSVALPVAAAAVFPFSAWGMRISLFALAAGVLGLQLRPRGLKRLSLATAFVGLVSCLQAGVVGLFSVLFADRHFALPLSFFDYWIPRLLGIRTTVIGQQVFFPSRTGFAAVVPTWDQLAVVFGLITCVGAAVLIVLGSPSERRWRAVVRGLLITGAYVVVRRLFLVLLVVDGAPVVAFWSRAATGLSLLPAFLLLWVFVGVRSELVVRRARILVARFSLRRGVVASVLAFVGTAAAACFLFLAVPGKTNGEVVLFDEAHGNWESTLRAMDKEWYGKQSTYNYHSLYNWLSYYYDVGRIREPISAQTLDGCDVLIVKIPSKPHTTEEIEAIAEFVRRGGGLFAIGDHTNVFGSTSSLNPLLRAFGLALNYDSTYDLATSYFTRFAPARDTLDPIMQHVDHFQFLTSCTIRAPWWAWRPILDTSIITTQADYSTKDFFAEDRYKLTSTYGAFTQAAALPFGLGRVLIHTDSTCFSNFSLHMDGYPKFILSSLSFLSRQNPRFPIRMLLGAISLGCLLLIGAWLVKMNSRSAPCLLLIIAAAALGWAAFSLIGTTVHRTAYPLPQAVRDIPYVYFDVPHSVSVVSPTPAGKSANMRYYFETFFVWTQRVGQVPVLLVASEDADLEPGRPYIIIHPRSNPDIAFLNRLKMYVEAGGKLVLFESTKRSPAGLKDILGQFALQVEATNDATLVLTGADVKHIAPETSAAVSLSMAQRGEGVVVLFTDSSFFSDAYLGGSFTVPSSAQRELYDLEYRLFEELLHRPADAGDDAPVPQGR